MGLGADFCGYRGFRVVLELGDLGLKVYVSENADGGSVVRMMPRAKAVGDSARSPGASEYKSRGRQRGRDGLQLPRLSVLGVCGIHCNSRSYRATEASNLWLQYDVHVSELYTSPCPG